MPPAPQQNQPDSSYTPMWVCAFLIIGSYCIWWAWHEQITYAFIQFKIYELRFLGYFTSSTAPLAERLSRLPTGSYAEISPEQLIGLSAQVGNYLKYPIFIIFAAIGTYIYFRSPKLEYRRTYTMDKLAEEERVNWPQITPVVKLDLVKTDINVGPWASSMTPMQFVKKYNLFQEVKAQSSEATLAHKAKYAVVLLPEQAYRIFCLQLGRYWTGYDNLPIHIQALFAAFAARIDNDKPASDELLMQIAASTESGKLNFTNVKELLAKHANNKEVQRVVQSHAYVYTVLASMLERARLDGVLSSSLFLWLKPVDRQMWYMLNSIGRQTAFSEVAGPFAHWKAEKEFGQKIMVPMVSEAVKALDMALKDILYVPSDNDVEA